MSTEDLKIQNRCDHRIQGELVPLRPDRVSLYPQKVVAATGTLEVYRYGILLDKAAYSIVDSQSEIAPFADKKIKLLVTDRAISPIYELNYVTASETCPKCLGTLFTDDIDVGQDGNLKEVIDSGLLAQLVEKHIITRSSSNAYHPWIGSRLHNLVGTKTADFDYVVSEIKLQVRQSLDKLKEAQQALRSSNPEVSSQEVLSSVTSIDVSQDARDPSIFYVGVVYKSAGGTQLEFEQALELSSFRTR